VTPPGDRPAEIARPASEVGPTLACTARRAYHVALYGPPEYPGDGIGEPSKREVDAWAAAISAATRVLNADRDRLRAELRQAAMIADNRAASLKAANQGWTEASRERDEACSDANRMRVLVGDILAALGPRPNGISDPQVAKWRKRAEKRP
jgi:hypothetical protein